MPRSGAALAVVLTLTVLSAAASAKESPRLVEYAVSLSGTQTTTWTSHGSVRWCAASSQQGRRRTGFILFHGVVQSVVLGCRQTDPHEPGAPVADDLVC